MRRALAHQIRQIYQAVAAGSYLPGCVVHQHIGVETFGLSHFELLAAEVVSEPIKRKTGGECDAHHMPLAGHGATKRVHPALRVDLHF